MKFSFYFFGILSILTTLRVITHTNPIRALLYFIVSLLSVAGVFFSLGAYFVGALEIIIYASSIMVLFLFVVMMLNFGKKTEEQECAWTSKSLWILSSIFSIFLLSIIITAIFSTKNQKIINKIMDVKFIGISLFGPYVLVVELVSILLLAALIVAYHIGCEDSEIKGKK